MLKINLYKIFSFCIICGALSLALASCSDDDTAIDFSISNTELQFPCEGGKQVINVNAGKDWTVSCDAEWCLISPSTGDATTKCEVSVDTSYLYKAREAHLSFHCGNKTMMAVINQFGYEKVINLDRDSIIVNDFSEEEDGMSELVKVTSNVKYSVSIEYKDANRTGWLSAKTIQDAKIESVPRSGKVRIDYQLYLESDKNREAYVVFRQTDAKAGETPIETKLPVVQKKAQEIIPSREGDSLTLVTLSRLMHLNTSWDLSQSMIYWNNIKLEDRTYYNEKLKKTVTEPRVVSARFAMFNTNDGIPYHVRYLDQLEDLSLMGNSNAHMKKIDLGEHVTYLSKLKYLSLLGYGISQLPERMKQMDKLVELDLSGNNLTEIPLDIIAALDQKSLRYINLANNRRNDVFGNLYSNRTSKDTLGLHGDLPEALFKLKNIRYIGLSYNYFEGNIPDMGYDASQYSTLEEKVKNNPIMPQLEQLSINLNYLSGEIPDWLLYHPNLRCWDPYTLVFNQYERSRDSRGRNTGFSNEPATVEQVCHLWDNEEDNDVVFSRKNTFDSTVKYYTRFGVEER